MAILVRLVNVSIPWSQTALQILVIFLANLPCWPQENTTQRCILTELRSISNRSKADEDQEGKDLVSYGKLPSLDHSFFIFKMCSLDWIDISQMSTCDCSGKRLCRQIILETAGLRQIKQVSLLWDFVKALICPRACLISESDKARRVFCFVLFSFAFCQELQGRMIFL